MNKLKKVISLVMLSLVLFAMTGITASAQEQTEVIIENEGGISMAKIDSSGTIALSGGGYFTKTFTMSGFLGIGTDHNAFNVKISNITQGGCTVSITGSNGYSWNSSMISSNTTITTTNANANTTYTVTITGHNLYGCSGNYSITSFIQ